MNNWISLIFTVTGSHQLNFRTVHLLTLSSACEYCFASTSIEQVKEIHQLNIENYTLKFQFDHRVNFFHLLYDLKKSETGIFSNLAIHKNKIK